MNPRSLRVYLLLLPLVLVGVAYLTFPIVKGAVNFVVWRLTSTADIRTGYAVNDDVRIHYTVYGVGAPLVLLHGGLSSKLDWLGEIPALAQHFQLVLIDSRGHGRSFVGTQPFDYRLLASDLKAVLDTLGIAQTDIAGWSDGGNTGLTFAIDYPARIRRLVAISANYHPDGIVDEVRKVIATQPDRIDPLLSRWLHRWQSNNPEGWQILRKRITRMWRHYPQLSQDDLRALRVPTLAIVGAKDDVDLNHAKAMVAAMPNASLVVIAGVGHAVPQNAPDAVTAHMLRFLLADLNLDAV